MKLHLDPVGGVSGDMFVAALLDAWPDLEGTVREALGAVHLPPGVRVEVAPHKDHALAGTRFRVRDSGTSVHVHTPYRAIREQLGGSDLAPGACERALDVFSHLARAEARVHGVPVDEVAFHEVGAWDSIADIVAAASLIDALDASAWSLAPLPLGSGRVSSAHGPLPVPAPATALLLEGFAVHDDGLPGERVTPTGAAILRHLEPTPRALAEPVRIGCSGTGFGTRELPGLSNVLRVLAFETLGDEIGHERVALVTFEVDDQPAEDLALGLERIRALEGVLDVLQTACFGKKGRLTTQVQVLARPEALDAALRACFSETTTLGLRWQTLPRAALRRGTESVHGPAGSIQVKWAARPSGARTGKAEIDDVADAEGGFAERARLRRAAEEAALRRRDED